MSRHRVPETLRERSDPVRVVLEFVALVAITLACLGIAALTGVIVWVCLQWIA